ncbi:MAG: dTDP-4-dehydrorhamnose 3,5-epimerase [Solirubrobacterales bacterium]
MEVIPTDLDGVVALRTRQFADARGVFTESFNQARFRQAGIDFDPMQDNHVVSTARFTVRGLHWQAAPFAQAKLVRVLKGAILDVVVDIRPGSPTFGRHIALELSAENWLQLFIPAGLAHGYCTLTADCEVLYKVDRPWSQAHERGLNWADPELAITWPVGPAQAVIHPRDAALPVLSHLEAA